MKVLFIALLTLLVLTECTKDKERKSILGGWKCEEITEMSGLRTYQVNILRSRVDTALYEIYNFHSMGDSENDIVYCYENEDGNLVIDHQLIISNSAVISDGLGIVAADFSSISWTYNYSDPYISNEMVQSTFY